MKHATTLCAIATVALSGCSVGSDDASLSGDDSDTRGAALACITAEKGREARVEGDSEILVGDPSRGPRVVFYLTSGQAEAVQFEGEGEGSEQIGSALLFVREASEEVLEDVEACLAEL
ncbi:MAG TPA: hypothetical protein VFQ12_11140 [Thermoleophilaceae bacterium]|nr:hypothetical protein [Thermoleophilaceae bacterium]